LSDSRLHKIKWNITISAGKNPKRNGCGSFAGAVQAFTWKYQVNP
jgi:hypothetical protein